MKTKAIIAWSAFAFLYSSIGLPILAAPDAQKAAAMTPIHFVEDEIVKDYKTRGQKLRTMLLAKDYDGLDKIAEALLTSKEQYPSGIWKLDLFFTSFSGDKS